MAARTRTCTRGGISVIGAAALSMSVSAGCTMDGPAADRPERTASVGQDVLGVCAPLTCCFPSGGGWANDLFEDQLRALGCTEPHAYTESYGQSRWWLYSSCPSSPELVDLVANYALVSPYYSQFVVNACLEAQGVEQSQPTSVFVEWDPTCGSCSYDEYFYPEPAIAN